MKQMESTLLLLRREGEILLAKKKRGFGEGKWNGVGGKLEADETAEEAMKRECEEEIHVTPTVYEKMGVMHFLEPYKGTKMQVTFHLYVATQWTGTPSESEEMDPKWFPVDQLPYDQMFEDDKYWLPFTLAGKKAVGYFEYDDNWVMTKHEVEEVGSC